MRLPNLIVKAYIRCSIIHIGLLKKFGLVKIILKKLEEKRSNYTDIHNSAVKALIEIGKPAVDCLLDALKKKNIFKHEVIKALGEIGDSKAVAPLIQMLNNKNERNVTAKEEAVVALGKIGDKSVVPFLISILKIDSSYRDTIVEVLGNLGDKSAIDPLIDFVLLIALTEKNYRSDNLEVNISMHKHNKERRSRGIKNIFTALDKLGWKTKSEKDKMIIYLAEEDFNKIKELAYTSAANVAEIVSLGLEIQDNFVPLKHGCDEWNIRYDIRAKLVDFLGEIENDFAITKLISIVKNPNEGYPVRKTTIYLLAKKQDARASKILNEYAYIANIVCGGFDEPYCSINCFNKAGKEISNRIFAGANGICAFCQSTVYAGKCILFPYQQKLFFVCLRCIYDGKEYMKKINECCMCGKIFK